MDVLGLGIPVWDQILLLETLPTTNQNARVLDMTWQYGGKVPTAMAALARLGCSCAMMGAVGGAYGEDCRLDLERHGVDCSHLIDRKGTMTFACLALAEKSTGGRSFLGLPTGLPAPQMLLPEEMDETYVRSAKYLLLSDLDDASLTAARWVRQAGGQVVIDADSYSDRIAENLSVLDHLVASEFFYRHEFGDSTDHERNLRSLKARMSESAVVIVTLGEKGLVGLDETDAFFSLPAFTVEVMDTTGAGDVFHGGYIAGLLHGRNVRQACRYASAVSAIKCTRLGGRAGIPTHEMTEQFLATGQIPAGDLDERVRYYKQSPLAKRG